MSLYGSASGKAYVNLSQRENWVVCDRCGCWRNRSDVAFQYRWQGRELINQRFIVCIDTCLDKPNQQERVIIIPADPVPVRDARPEAYFADETGNVSTEDGTNNVVDEPDLNFIVPEH